MARTVIVHFESRRVDVRTGERFRWCHGWDVDRVDELIVMQRRMCPSARVVSIEVGRDES